MRRLGFLAFVLTLLALTGPAAAQWQRPPPYRNVPPLDRWLPGIRMTHPGRFYDAEGPYPDAAGNMHYRLKWLTPEGRVIWLDTDARTGRVIGRAGGPAGPPVNERYGPPAPYGRGYAPGWGRPGYGGWGPRQPAGGWGPRGAAPAGGGRRPGF